VLEGQKHCFEVAFMTRIDCLFTHMTNSENYTVEEPGESERNRISLCVEFEMIFAFFVFVFIAPFASAPRMLLFLITTLLRAGREESFASDVTRVTEISANLRSSKVSSPFCLYLREKEKA
jgi:hypothetical protein